jgi:hypothetical protein
MLCRECGRLTYRIANRQGTTPGCPPRRSHVWVSAICHPSRSLSNQVGARHAVPGAHRRVRMRGCPTRRFSVAPAARRHWCWRGPFANLAVMLSGAKHLLFPSVLLPPLPPPFSRAPGCPTRRFYVWGSAICNYSSRIFLIRCRGTARRARRLLPTSAGTLHQSALHGVPPSDSGIPEAGILA